MRAFLILICCATVIFAAEPEAELLRKLTTKNSRDAAIDKGLAFLHQQQAPEGSIGRRHRPALTSLAIIAYLSAGHTFDDKTYGETLKKGLTYVLSQQERSGYFGHVEHGQMYGHGIATLMLAESVGMINDPDLEERAQRGLERAVSIIINAAKIPKELPHTGGWHYKPDATESDLSLSGWQLMSLHAAQQVGVNVPEQVISAAVDYARRLTSPDGKVGYRRQGEDHPALRGLGILSLAIGNKLATQEAQAIAQKIQSDPIVWGGKWFYYRTYYDAVGLSRGFPKAWESYRPLLEDILIKNQAPDGSWLEAPGGNEAVDAGLVYTTAMAVLALSVERHVLPAYQR